MARQWKIGDAKREGLPVLIGVAGPSGSGKTFTALRLGSGVQSVVGGDLAVLDTEGGRALEYADRFKFKHVPFEAPFNALAYLEALKWIEAQGVKTCVIDSMSHEHEGDGGHLAMHEAEMERMVKAGWGSRDKAQFAAWAKPAAERRALVLYLQQRRMNLILCFRAKDKIVLVQNGGKQVPTSIGWQPIAGDDYAYEMKAIAVLPPRSKGVPDWSKKAEAAKINAGMESLFPKDGEPLDEATGARFAKWAAGETGTRGQALNAAKPKPAGQDKPPPEEGDEPPPFVPEGGWPKFQSTVKWADWSTGDFLPKADRRAAQAWLDYWSKDWLRVQDAARNGNDGAAKMEKTIDAALKAAMKREPK